MGIIAKQSVKGTVYSYIGAGFGFVNTAVLFPILFSAEQIGLIFLLVSVAMIFATVFSLGFNNVTLRLFPYFNNKENTHNGFSFILFIVTISGIILFLVSFFLVKGKIAEQNEHSPEFIKNLFLIIPLVIAEILFRVLNSYTSVLLNTVIGTFYKEFILRVLISILILLFVLKLIDYTNFLYLYVSVQLIPPLALLIYLVKEKEISFKYKPEFISKKLRKAMLFTAIVGLITGIGSSGYQYIDKYMINTLLNLSNTGVYTIAFFFGSMISLPTRSLKKIASVIIAQSWKEDRIKDIDSIYKKSSITQTLIGMFIFIGIMINVDDVIAILGQDYAAGKFVIFFIGLSFLTELISGMSSAIISNSKQYAYILYFMVVFVVTVIITNYIFIPIFGITGAAFASFVSMFIFSVMKYIFILKRFKIQPFSKTHLYILTFGVLSFAGFYFFPNFLENKYFNIILKSFVFTLFYVFLIYKFNFSIDINTQINNILKKIAGKHF